MVASGGADTKSEKPARLSLDHPIPGYNAIDLHEAQDCYKGTSDSQREIIERSRDALEGVTRDPP